jgi:hypothetical protein
MATRCRTAGGWTRISPKNSRGVNAKHGHKAISGSIGEDDSGLEFSMCAMCYGEEEGITIADYTVPVIKDIEEETFDFFDGARTENKGSV